MSSTDYTSLKVSYGMIEILHGWNPLIGGGFRPRVRKSVSLRE